MKALCECGSNKPAEIVYMSWGIRDWQKKCWDCFKEEVKDDNGKWETQASKTQA